MRVWKRAWSRSKRRSIYPPILTKWIRMTYWKTVKKNPYRWTIVVEWLYPWVKKKRQLMIRGMTSTQELPLAWLFTRIWCVIKRWEEKTIPRQYLYFQLLNFTWWFSNNGLYCMIQGFCVVCCRKSDNSHAFSWHCISNLTWMLTLSMTQEMTWSTCIFVSHSVTCCNSWKSSPNMDSRY